MAKKNNAPTAKPVTKAMDKLINDASRIGYEAQGAFQAGVTLATSIGEANEAALSLAQAQYVGGFAVRYSESHNGKAYAKRVGNMDLTQRVEDMLTIALRSRPDAKKANAHGRRSDVEHKGLRGGAKSWAEVKRIAFNIQPKKRAPSPATVPAEEGNAPPVDAIMSKPTLATAEDCNTHFAAALAALLDTVNKNSKKVKPAISTAISDCNAAIKAALAN